MERKINKIKIFKNDKEKSNIITSKLIEELEKNHFELVEENYDLAISIGGDGTFLHMLDANHFNENICYIGINTGNLGFLQEINGDEYKLLIDKLNNNSYTLEEQYLQETEIITSNKKYQYFSLNEIVIRNQDLRVLESEVKIDEEYLESFAGDGILICTSIGSTAYNLGFGGSIIDKEINALSITSIAPLKNKVYKNLTNSIIVPGQKKITIIPKKHNILLTIDGSNIILEDILNITTNMSKKRVKCLKLKNNNFIKRVNNKLLGE